MAIDLRSAETEAANARYGKTLALVRIYRRKAMEKLASA